MSKRIKYLLSIIKEAQDQIALPSKEQVEEVLNASQSESPEIAKPVSVSVKSSSISQLQKACNNTIIITNKLVVDGKWGSNTLKAVKIIHNEIVKKIRELYDFKIDFKKVFSIDDLGNFREALDPFKESSENIEIRKISLQTKINSAKILIPLINKVPKLLKFYDNEITNNPRYSQYITDKKPMFTINKQVDKIEGQTSFNKEEINIINELTNTITVNLGITNNPQMISLSSLKDKQSLYNAILRPLGYSKTDSKTYTDVLNNILQQINTISPETNNTPSSSIDTTPTSSAPK